MAAPKVAFPLIIMLVFAIIGGVLSLVFSNFLQFSRTPDIATTAPGTMMPGFEELPPEVRWGLVQTVYGKPSREE